METTCYDCNRQNEKGNMGYCADGEYRCYEHAYKYERMIVSNLRARLKTCEKLAESWNDGAEVSKARQHNEASEQLTRCANQLRTALKGDE